MIWLAILHIFSTVLELVHIGRLSDNDKYLEIIILRRQLDVMPVYKPVVLCKNKGPIPSTMQILNSGNISFHFFTLPYPQSVLTPTRSRVR